MAEGARLLSVYRRNPIPGSNPGRSASFSFTKSVQYKGFISSIETPPVPGQPVKLNLTITSIMIQALAQPVAQYNQWAHRATKALLSESQFEIELSDFPVFWQQFLITLKYVQIINYI